MKRYLTAIAALTIWTSVSAASLDVPINLYAADGAAKTVGTITIDETQYGLLFTPHLTGLPPGLHGFHLHENPSCDAVEKEGKLAIALAAGGHMDPSQTGQHLGPYNDQGHLGDLPALYVSQEGSADYPVLAPKLTTLDQVKNRAVMIHAGGDNNSDHPVALGGGGARIACGVIQ